MPASPSPSPSLTKLVTAQVPKRGLELELRGLRRRFSTSAGILFLRRSRFGAFKFRILVGAVGSHEPCICVSVASQFWSSWMLRRSIAQVQAPTCWILPITSDVAHSGASLHFLTAQWRRFSRARSCPKMCLLSLILNFFVVLQSSLLLIFIFSKFLIFIQNTQQPHREAWRLLHVPFRLVSGLNVHL